MRRRSIEVALSSCLILTLAACGSQTPSEADGGGTESDPPPSSAPASQPAPSELPTPAPSETPLPNANEVMEDVTEAEEEEVAEQEVTAAQPAIFISEQRPGRPDPGTTRAYIDAVVRHLDTVWTQWFLGAGLEEPWVSYTVIMPGEVATSICSDPATGTPPISVDSVYNNAFYCPIDPNESDNGAIFLPVDTISDMWTGDMFDRQVSDLSKVGDFAAAILVAHEFGHHVQDELTEQVGVPKPAGINSEQIADCFAGVWAYTVWLDGYMETGDIDEAFLAIGVIGDLDPNRSTHGSGEQRQNAFLLGYNGSQANPVPGVPVNCIEAFWPEWMALLDG
jgi:predicted metalloprotease